MALLIVTHENPDLDAIGFVYSAKKKFDSNIQVECRRPSRMELKDPKVIVGDVGLPDCAELGYNPALNNFDHHFGCAKNSATFLFNQKYHVLREDIVSYIDDVDLGRRRDETKVNINVVMAGIRISYENDDVRIVNEGCDFLKYIEEENLKPNDLPENLPEKFQPYVQIGLNELRRIEGELIGMISFKTDTGRLIGYVQTSSKTFSLVGDIVLTNNPKLEVILIHNPGKKRYSIRSNTFKSEWVNLTNRVKLIELLNEAEWSKGLPHEQKWGGREDRIGSPKPSGSLLSPEEIVNILKRSL